jgi:UDP-GlcNAc3NAcA epimerase
MVWMLKNCEWVLTDSGGLQKEAFFFKKKCITLREETEWIELVENGFNVLVGSDSHKIVYAISQLGENKPLYNKDLYGNGNACERIIKAFLS